MGNKTLQELVETYCKSPADGLRNSIITKSMPLIRSIIGKINRPDKPLTQREDLESAGISGLIQAMDTYDHEKNIQFNTYAYYRIRGNIIDYLRKIDQLPRKQRKNYGQVQEVIDRKSQELGREPSDFEIATEMEMDIEDYYKLLSNVQQRNALSLDTTFDDDSNSFYEVHANPESETPDRNLERKELAEGLKRKIGELEERDRLILTLYYYEDMTMSEIALLLKLSEARISQIVGKLLIQLKHDLIKEEIVS
ncbi:MAG: FliA/WhiG family RNA polymerase sigma factor [Balneolaceae bacterium]|nr:FliA/WhiG family RNA polymerase sigma factor [Balneolaceae bacterium]MCH8547282.1 FliA/WhiG family RNA polymerase sigma factor [Balneolaceae bacterium]